MNNLQYFDGKVKTLIKLLSTMNPEADVKIYHGDCYDIDNEIYDDDGISYIPRDDIITTGIDVGLILSYKTQQT